ncbi:MAG: hypothetical protein ACRENB_01730 [Gemmatimonadales bacterium]
MIRVTVRERAAGGLVKQLDAYQARLFLRELRRVRLLWFLGGPRGRPYRISPDCIIEVHDNGRVTRYELFGRFVLLHTRSRRTYQFYFGLLLLEWLHA